MVKENIKDQKVSKIISIIIVIVGISFLIFKFHSVLLGFWLVPLLFFGCLFGGGC